MIQNIKATDTIKPYVESKWSLIDKAALSIMNQVIHKDSMWIKPQTGFQDFTQNKNSKMNVW